MRYSRSVADSREQTDGAVKERTKVKKQDPTLFKVVLLNDDYSTMAFVVHILETIFQKSPAEAYGITMQVHQQGRGLAGVYPLEIAETKVEELAATARQAEYPLRATIEPE
jgi:ATP-dependent Clp protease adaptor protein ClpS